MDEWNVVSYDQPYPFLSLLPFPFPFLSLSACSWRPLHGQGMADAVRGDLFIPAGAIRDLSVAVLDHGDRVLHHGERHHLDRS